MVRRGRKQSRGRECWGWGLPLQTGHEGRREELSWERKQQMQRAEERKG